MSSDSPIGNIPAHSGDVDGYIDKLCNGVFAVCKYTIKNECAVSRASEISPLHSSLLVSSRDKTVEGGLSLMEAGGEQSMSLVLSRLAECLDADLCCW